MKTKQEVVSFLESKLGTKVPCKGTPSLDGQCVTLIKSLLEFLGAPDPYKARGHAATAISAYLKEGIAKPGLGFISVFSNKNMASPYGHVWCNAGDGAGTFYESNGVKPLIVTKGKTYTYDNVCNFDQYIKEEVNLSDPKIEELQKQLDEANLHKSNLQTQVNGLLADIKKWEVKYEECNTQRIEAGTSSDGFRKQLNDLIASLASKLGTRQETVEINSAIDTLLTYEDKADQLDRTLELERKEHEYAISTLEKKIKALESNLVTLKADFKALKDTQVAPSKLEPKYSIFEYIVNLFRR